MKAVSKESVRITFGIIVLNGEPFTRYNLRSLYPWAHQIIVVEGACPGAASVATPDGHSIDGTVEAIRAFIRDEDQEHKVVLVTAEEEGHPDGFWSEKDEMSQAYAKRATGSYLWQVDVDEFYTEGGFRAVHRMLSEISPDAVSFRTLSHWGSPQVIAEGFYQIVSGGRDFHRLFRWKAGFHYLTHRPPTVLDEQGVDLRKKQWIRADEMLSRGVVLHHYCFLLPEQVAAKAAYYSAAAWACFPAARVWAENCYNDLKHPFRVIRDYQEISWLRRTKVEPPAEIRRLWESLQTEANGSRLRRQDDVDALLRRLDYRLVVVVLRLLAYSCRPLIALYDATKNRARGTALFRLVKMAADVLLVPIRRWKGDALVRKMSDGRDGEGP